MKLLHPKMSQAHRVKVTSTKSLRAIQAPPCDQLVTPAFVHVGVDPGLNGALAFYDALTGEFYVVDMPTLSVVRNGKKRRKIDGPALAAVIDLYTNGRSAKIWFEQVGAMPGQGVTSMFSFGRATGVVEGEFYGQGFDIEPEIPPRVWQRALGLDAKGDKSVHRKLAQKLYPKHAHLFERQKDDGRADAALILHYGRTQEQQ
jgi:crossover junction endodeoxyribonuclease RuvC